MNMEAVERLREAVLRAAREKADKILAEARENAESIIRRAEEERKRRLEEEGSRILSEARLRAREIVAEAKLQAKAEVSKAKLKVLEDLKGRVMEALSSLEEGDREKSLRSLIQEALKYIPPGRVVIAVSPRDLEIAKRIVSELGIEADVVTAEISGGAIVSTADGGVKVLNSYEQRLQEHLEKRMHEVMASLFGEGR